MLCAFEVKDKNDVIAMLVRLMKEPWRENFVLSKGRAISRYNQFR